RLVGRGEVSRDREGLMAFLCRWPAVVLLEQVDNDGVEALLPAVLEVLLGLVFRQLDKERPCGVAMDEKRLVVRIHEVAMVGADLERERGWHSFLHRRFRRLEKARGFPHAKRDILFKARRYESLGSAGVPKVLRFLHGPSLWVQPFRLVRARGKL